MFFFKLYEYYNFAVVYRRFGCYRAFKYNNYSFFPANFNDGCAFCNCCQYKYDTIVDLLIKSHRNLIEKKIIQEKLLFNKIYLHN